MKKIVKTGCLFLGICLATMSLFGCDKKQDADNAIQKNSISVEKRVNEYICKDGTSEYSVVIPYSATEYEALAAQELTLLLEESTGVELEIVSDSGLTYSDSAKYISIGNTTLVEESGIVLHEEYLGNYGSRVATKGDSIFLWGATDTYGIVFSTYKFLYYTIGFESYAFGVYDMQKNSTLNMFDLDVLEKPANGLTSVNAGGDYINSLRMYMGRCMNEEFRALEGVPGHNLPVLIFPGTYREEHPDWFAQGSTIDQLCLSNQEMWDELAKNMFAKLQMPANKKITNFLLSMGDGGGYCHCERCTSLLEKYDGKNSAIAIRFLNAVGDKVDALMKEAGDLREMQYVFLAYNEYDDPPVKKDSKGEYVPIDETCVLRKNRLIQLAPMALEFCNLIDDPNSNVNVIEYEKFKGWNAITDELEFYGYGTNFEDYFFGFNNWGAMQRLAQEMAKMNITYAMWDGAGYAYILSELNLYMIQGLSANPYQDVDAMIQKFCKFYYKDAADAIIEYYEAVRAHYAYLQKDMNVGASCYYTFSAKEWPYQMLRKMEGILDKAFTKIEKYKTSDPNLYETLYNRINKETLTYRYATLLWYWGYYTKSQRVEMIDSFERDCALYGITAWRNESFGALDRRITQFRGNLSVG